MCACCCYLLLFFFVGLNIVRALSIEERDTHKYSICTCVYIMAADDFLCVNVSVRATCMIRKYMSMLGAGMKHAISV